MSSIVGSRFLLGAAVVGSHFLLNASGVIPGIATRFSFTPGKELRDYCITQIAFSSLTAYFLPFSSLARLGIGVMSACVGLAGCYLGMENVNEQYSPKIATWQSFILSKISGRKPLID